MKKYIRNIIIDATNKPQRQTHVPFIVQGDIDAVFSIKVMQNQNNVIKFYNFIDSTFDSDFKAANSLSNIKLSNQSYSNKITLPTISSNEANYTVFVHAEAHFDTLLSESFSPQNNICYALEMKQVLDSTLTFGMKVSSSDEAHFVSTSIAPEDVGVTSTGSPISPTMTILNPPDFGATYGGWAPTNTVSDARGNGLILSRQPTANDWVFRQNQTVDGAISSATTVILDSVDRLAIGMQIVVVGSGGSLSGTPYITNIDTNKIVFPSITAEYNEQLTKTVRAAVSNTNVTLNNTYGIAKGATIRGVGINNSSANVIQSVGADADGGGGDGVIAVQVNQTLTAGTKIYIDGCSTVIVIKPTIQIHSYPEENATIYLVLNDVITAGAAS